MEKPVVVERVIQAPRKPEQMKPVLRPVGIRPARASADVDEDWGEVSYRGPALKTDARGVFMVDEAIMSYTVFSGTDKFYFSLETKALNQTFNLYNKVYFGKRYEQRARQELEQLGVKAASRGQLVQQIHKIFKAELETLCREIIDEKKQPETWIPTLKAAVQDHFAR